MALGTAVWPEVTSGNVIIIMLLINSQLVAFPVADLIKLMSMLISVFSICFSG